MANYNKSFNFRNGVQVDEDDLIVRGSLVGIGTTIPRADLDVNGTVQVSGIVTTRYLYAGIATFASVNIGAGITIDGNAGIVSAKFYGDGAGLYNIPTSQWVDVDPAIYPGVGVGYSSIYASGTVGINTNIPRFSLQIGGDPGLNQNGVGINSTGNIKATGIITAGFFVGSGAGVTSIDASNISSGTLSNSRLASDISVSGVITATTFNGQVNAGVGTIATLNSTNGTVTNLSSTNLSGTIGTVTTLNSTSATVTNLSGTIGTVTTLSGTTLNYSGVGTVTTLNSTSAVVTNLTATVGIITNLSGNNLNYTGIATVGILTATQATIGVLTATSSKSGSVQLGVTAANQVDTTSGNLVLDSADGLVDINDNIDVLGTSVLQGEVTVNTGIVPDTSVGAYLGQTGKQFLESWIGDLKIAVGVGNSNKIETSNQDLILDSATNKVNIDANLNVAGVSSFTGNVTIGAGIEPSSDFSSTLGTASKRFVSSQIGAIRVGVAQTFEIDTVDGKELILNSAAGNTRINDNVFVSGIGSFGGEVTVDTGIVPNSDKGSYIGTSGRAFSEAFIDEIRIGVAATNKIDTRTGSLLLNSADSLVNVESNLLVTGISTLTGNVTFGSDNNFFVNNSSGRVGIGTNILTNKFQVKDTVDLTTEFRSDTGNVTIGIGRSIVGAGQSVGKLSYSLKSLSLVNEDTGGIQFINHSGNAGINTGSFSWIYGQNNNTLMSLSYDGKLGLGVTTASNTLHVVGTSTVTGTAYFGGDVNILGNLTANLNLPGIIEQSNINSTTGISTFNDIEVLNVLSCPSGFISIGTTFAPQAGLDALNVSALFGSVGIGTTVIDQTTLHVYGATLLQSVSIGNTTLDDGSGVGIFGGTTTISKNTVSGISSSVVIFDSTCAVGIGSTLPKCALDCTDAGKNVEGGKAAYMIVPVLTSSQITGLSTYEGAIIFNTTTKKFQGFTGIAWTDFH